VFVDCENLKEAMEVCNFAHKWQLDMLYKITVASCFQFEMTPETLFLLCEMFQRHDNQPKHKYTLLVKLPFFY